MDCIPLRPFHHFARLAQTASSGIAAYDSTDNTIGVGFLAARAGGDAITRLQQHVMDVVHSGHSPGWLEVSSEPMTRIVGEIGRENCPIIPLEHVAPISWRDMYVMYGRDTDANHRGWLDPRPSTYCFMLSNQALGDDVRQLTRHELLTSDRLISFLFRESIARLQAMQAPPVCSGKAVICLNLYDDGMPKNVRASQRAAAERWNAEYVEITHPQFGWQDPFLEKLHLDRHAAGHDRVVCCASDWSESIIPDRNTCEIMVGRGLKFLREPCSVVTEREPCNSFVFSDLWRPPVWGGRCRFPLKHPRHEFGHQCQRRNWTRASLSGYYEGRQKIECRNSRF